MPLLAGRSAGAANREISGPEQRNINTRAGNGMSAFSRVNEGAERRAVAGISVACVFRAKSAGGSGMKWAMAVKSG